MLATTTRERPIMFSGEMVRAILDGRKTQTRRVVKNAGAADPDIGHWCQDAGGDWIGWAGPSSAGMDAFTSRVYPAGSGFPCPYGRPGDRLWVREVWQHNFSCHVSHNGYLYRATAATDQSHHGYWAKEVSPGKWVDHYDRPFRWRSPIHMPRFACRILLEITRVRVQRLQWIGGNDIRAEGVDTSDGMEPTRSAPRSKWEGRYRRLWESINGPGSWDANPWVWALTFKRV